MRKYKSNLSKFNSYLNLKNGFTLVELIVAIAILGSLVVGGIVAFNPSQQVSRARDAATVASMQEIKKALDVYYSDNSCYPQGQSIFTTALNTGTEWSEGNSVYMTKVPFDATGQPFIYLTDNVSSCPQWNVLFARLENENDSVDICPLKESGQDCLPEGFDNRWACTTSGTTNCAQISGSEIDGTVIVYPTASPSGTITPTQSPSGSADFTIAMPSTVRPQFFTGNISSTQPSQGSNITLKISTDGFSNPYPITSVVATVESDNSTVAHPMFLSSGTQQNGEWSSTWTQSDTVNHTFIITIDAQDSNGNQSTVDVVIR